MRNVLKLFTLYNHYFIPLNELLIKGLKSITLAFFCGDFNVNFDNADSKNATFLQNLFLFFGLYKSITAHIRAEGDSKSTLGNIFSSFHPDCLSV